MGTQVGLDISQRVKVLVVGETGVGKTSLAAALAGRPLKTAPWTVGASVEVLLHNYRAGTSSERDFLVELWDVGGSRAHKAARRVFYPGAVGLILVHDLANRKSEEALDLWAAEVREGQAKTQAAAMEAVVSSSPGSPRGRIEEAEAELPTLLVGLKLDQAEGSYDAAGHRRLAARLGAEEAVALDAREALSPGSTASLQVAKFLDRAVATFCRRTPGLASLAQASDSLGAYATQGLTRRHY